jgi:hypothetical protein
MTAASLSSQQQTANLGEQSGSFRDSYDAIAGRTYEI